MLWRKAHIREINFEKKRCCSKILAVQVFSSCAYHSYCLYNTCTFWVLPSSYQELAAFKIDRRDGAGTQPCIPEHHSQKWCAYFQNSSRGFIARPPVKASQTPKEQSSFLLIAEPSIFSKGEHFSHVPCRPFVSFCALLVILLILSANMVIAGKAIHIHTSILENGQN